MISNFCRFMKLLLNDTELDIFNTIMLLMVFQYFSVCRFVKLLSNDTELNIFNTVLLLMVFQYFS